MTDLEKTETINELLDLYMPLLTEKQQVALKLVYQEDMSMQEAANLQGTSKQTIHFNIRNALKHMDNLEAGLHLLERNRRLQEFIDKYRNIGADDLDYKTLQFDLEKLQAE